MGLIRSRIGAVGALVFLPTLVHALQACTTYTTSSYVAPNYGNAEWELDAAASSGVQGHVAATISYFGEEVMVTYGGTTDRTDDVSVISADVTSVGMFNFSAGTANGTWSTHSMVYFESDESAVPAAVFKSASAVFSNSLFIMGGNLGDGSGVTSSIYRGDIEAFSSVGYGLWRSVAVTPATGESLPSGRYGHSLTLLSESGSGSGAQAWALLFGGMSSSQSLISDFSHIIKLKDTGTSIVCNATTVASILGLTSASSVDCTTAFAPARAYDTIGETWDLTSRLASSSFEPSARAYHAAATLASDGANGTSCVFLFGGFDYLGNTIMSDTWKLCPTQGYLNVASDTTFLWTELTSSTATPLARYGHALLSAATAARVLGSYRILLWGGTGAYPDLYMQSAYEYDAYLGEWLDAGLDGVGGVAPEGRRDHTLTAVGNRTYVHGGIDSDIDVLVSLWRANHSSTWCSAGAAMTACVDSAGTSAIAICTGCPSGSFAADDVYTCDYCPTGQYQGNAWSDGCSACPAGTYGNSSVQGAVSTAQGCVDCPAGTSCGYAGETDVSACSNCAAGYYSAAGASGCTPCPVGSSSAAGSSSCSTCSVGTYSVTSGGVNTCVDCPSGHYSAFTGASACLQCAAGFYSTSGASSCTPCSAGAYSAAGATSCTNCPSGHFAAYQGTKDCTACPVNTYRALTGATSSSACVACSSGGYSDGGASVCTSCPAGTYYTSSDLSCRPCEVNMYSTDSGATTSSVCTSCPSGTYTNSTGSDSAGDCLSCPPGTHSNATNPGCTDCPRGSYTKTYALAQSYECNECSEGYYAANTGASACAACVSSTEADGDVSSSTTIAYNGFAACVACDYNATCPIGPNNVTCSDHGTCSLGFCNCDAAFSGVDCSEGTCAACPGVFGFALGSHARVGLESDAGTSEYQLTVERAVGTQGAVYLQVDFVGSNATAGVDYTNATGTWPLSVSFADGDTSEVVTVPILDNAVLDQGCRMLYLQLAVAASDTSGAQIVTYAGIRDLSATAEIALGEDDFSAAVVDSTARNVSGGGGGLALSAATVMLGANSVNMSLSTGTTALNVSIEVPSNTALAAPLNILLATETVSTAAAHLSRLYDLLPGIAADLQANYNSVTCGVASFDNSGNSALAVASQAGTAADAATTLWQTSDSNTRLSQLAVQSVASAVTANSLASTALEGGGQVSALKTLANTTSAWAESSGAQWRVLVMLTYTPFYNNTEYGLTYSSGITTIIDTMSSEIAAAAASMRANYVTPLFVLANEAVDYASDYQALLDELGFGAVVYVDATISVSSGYNVDYLYDRIVEGMVVLATQAVLFVVDDDFALVDDMLPAVVNSATLGATLSFTVYFISSSAASLSWSASANMTVSLWYFGQTCDITVVTYSDTCDEDFGVAVAQGGATMATLDDDRRGWAQGFYDDEVMKWQGSNYAVETDVTGPFGVLASVLAHTGSGNGDVSMSFEVGFATAIPLVVKAYTKDSQGSTSTCELTLTVTFSDGSTSGNSVTLDWSTGTGAWEQMYDILYSENIITGGTIRLRGECDWAGVGVFVHPEPACVCAPGYFLNTAGGAARECDPQPSCRFFEASVCTYCPSGYACAQGGTRTACSGNEYSMGGYTACQTCPTGWLCDNGLASPCGFGKGTENTVEQNGTCVTCPTGRYCKDGISYTCPPGTFSEGGHHATRCVTCEPGTIAAQNESSSCTDCPAGSTSYMGTGACFPCDAGEYSASGQHPCASCPPGTFSNSGDTDCTDCPVDSYASYWASISCIDCPTGESTNGQTGATACS